MVKLADPSSIGLYQLDVGENMGNSVIFKLFAAKFCNFASNSPFSFASVGGLDGATVRAPAFYHSGPSSIPALAYIFYFFFLSLSTNRIICSTIWMILF